MQFLPAFGGPQQCLRLFVETFTCRSRDEVIRTMAPRRLCVWRITGGPGRWRPAFRLPGRKDTLRCHEPSTSVWLGVERPPRTPHPTITAKRALDIKPGNPWLDKAANKLVMGLAATGALAAMTGESTGAVMLTPTTTELIFNGLQGAVIDPSSGYNSISDGGDRYVKATSSGTSTPQVFTSGANDAGFHSSSASLVSKTGN